MLMARQRVTCDHVKQSVASSVRVFVCLLPLYLLNRSCFERIRNGNPAFVGVVAR